MKNAFTVVILLVLLAMTVINFISIWTDTGPGCPGDPEWLGRCSEIERQTQEQEV